MPETVSTIIWSQQLLTKAEESLKFAAALFSDLSGMESFGEEANEFIDDVRQFQQQQYDDWREGIMADLNDESGESELALETTGRLMDFEHTDGKLRVHYSDRLVTLLREVRQLGALGFVIPAKIQRTAATAKQFYRHGVILKQVAHFYNHIDDQIIDSQYTMLETYAASLESVIKAPKNLKSNVQKKGGSGSQTVTWGSSVELEQYVNQLQAAAERLTTENRMLRKHHHAFTDKVVGLMNVDLLRQSDKWKAGLLELRTTVEKLNQTKSFTPEALRPWQSHWDHQIYKALEHQYQMGLESLNENLPEIKVDLVFRHQKLQFRPPIEEIRAKYYREMKKFIQIPEKMIGLCGDSKLFSKLIDRNSQSFVTVYKKADSLFSRLGKAVNHFKDHVVLGTVDLDELIELNLVDVADWEANFKAIKAKGRESEKLPSIIRVDCVTVSTAPVKAAIDDQLDQLSDALLNALRKSVNDNLAEIDGFVTKGLEALSERPQTVEEIGQTNAKHAEMSKEKPTMKPLFQSAETKNRLLRSVAGAGVDLAPMTQRWDKFELMLESHALMIKEQVDIMRNNVESRIAGCVQAMEKFSSRWQALRPKDDALNSRETALEAIKIIKDRRQELDELVATAESIGQDCAHFELEPPDFNKLAAVRKDVEETEALWMLFDEFSGALQKMADESWIDFRSHLFDFNDLMDTWMSRLKNEQTNVVTIRIRSDLDKFADFAPLMKYLRGDAYSTDHWAELFRLLRFEKGMTLELLKFDTFLGQCDLIIELSDDIRALNARAQGEISIREALAELDMWGASASFSLTDYEDCQKRNVKLIKDWKDLVGKIGDNRSLLQSLKDSPFFGGFIDKATLWEKKLSDLDHFLSLLQVIQRKWIYLEPIFGRGALPKEQQRFDAINGDFLQIMRDVERDDRVVSMVGRSGLGPKLESLEDQLTRCQKALSEYLETKRAIFPRFYFIGDDDLLEILGQSTNPNVIQTHLKKLFSGIHRVEFNQSCTELLEMHSQLGETVVLSNPVQIHDRVESWLGDLAVEMKATMTNLLVDCVNEENGADPSLFPSQILCLAEQVRFTTRCEEAIQDGELDVLKMELQQQLEAYISEDIVPTDAQSNVLDAKLKSLTMDIIHMIEVVDVLKDGSVTDCNHWLWQKQLRYYVVNKQCRIRMCNGDFEYTYEYQGNAGKLVHTPLTDKCYLTLTQGMALGYGGNPYGPAGTGKTESVKALACAFGRQVLVFNCDEGIDVKSMGRIFIGLVKCGAWGCFDEFNRLEAEVLSAVSMQIQTIQHAIRERLPEAELLNRQVNIDPNAGIFITMNPAGKGYGGRQKLPDNLKQLFRPVAMSKPDLELIAEVILYSEGYKEAKVIGKKVVGLYNLSKQLLSKQQHYDWGLRPLKTILSGGGNLLTKYKQQNKEVTPEQETKLIVQAARVNTLSKLTYADAARFDQLCADLFPGVQHADIEYPELMDAIRESYAEMNLVYKDRQVKKMLEFYEQLTQRMGVVLVGPSGSGKSTLWRILHHALSKIRTPLKFYSMNPKSMPREQLLGHIDMDTREWFDGVLTNSARQVVKEPLDVNSWIICDGDIDPEWIESLNSVLDDNRLLTMPNGERIQFGPNVNFVFETHDLSCASPATVSRMGMIFLSDEDMEVQTLVQTYLKSCPEGNRQIVSDMIDDYLYKAIEWVNMNTSPSDFVLKQSPLGLAYNALSQLRDVKSKSEFVCALIRGLGGPLKLELRTNLAQHVFVMARETPPDNKRLLDCYSDQHGQLSVYTPDIAESITLDQLYAEPLILTRDAQRTMDTLQPVFDHCEPFVLVGPEGCGKYNLLKHAFSTLKSTAVAKIHCNAQTSPVDVMGKLQQMCILLNTNTGRVYRPKDAERLILYLKDLNLPKMDKWGTSPLVEFLQQAITYKGFYDQQLEWIGLENVQIISSMNPSTTLGRSELSSRFTSIVRVFYVDHTDHEQLQDVYNAYLTPVLTQRLPGDPQWCSPKNIMRLAGSMLAVYDAMRQRFSRDDYSHYLFSPRQLSEWTTGLLRYNLTSDTLLECWAYEARRIFEDLLVGDDARKFDALLRNILRTDWDYTEPEEPRSFITFSPIAKPTEASGLKRQGKQLTGTDRKTLMEIIDVSYKKYAREISELDLLMFNEVINRLVAVDRAIAKPGGAMLMAGRSGTGRRALVSLCAHMLRMETMTPRVNRGYSLKHFKVDLKSALHKAGVEGEPLLLILEDHHFVEPTFMELINSLLSTGEVPGLYQPNEIAPLLSPLQDIASEVGWRGTLFSFFASRVKANLRVVLIMDCGSSDFSITCESNPALYSKCSIMWMDRWTEESMITVAGMILGDTVFEFLADSSVTSRNICQIHESAVELGATPKQFTDCCNMYAKLYREKRQIKEQQQNRLKQGLEKLKGASLHVDELTEKAQEQSMRCSQKQLEADQALEDIQLSMNQASKQRTEAEELQNVLGVEEAKLAQRKKAIDIELAQVGPLLEQTKKAVGSIKSESLNEIRALRSPPEAVRDILSGVLTLMGIFDTSWVSMRSFLAKRGIKEDILKFDARKITPDIRVQVEDILRKHGKSFEPAAAKRASVACAPLAGWVKANLQFADVLEKVEPLETENQKLQNGLRESQNKLQELNNELSTIDEKVAGLRKRFENSTAEAAKLKMELEAAQTTIASAESLLGKLVGEKDRWEIQVDELATEIEMFANHALLAAAFIVYLSKATEDGRAAQMEKWGQILGIEKFDVRGFMASESEELTWRSEGLPSDPLSVENAVVILNSTSAAYLVDPASTGSEWLKTNLKDQRLVVCNQQDTDFTTSLELAVRFGKTLLIQEVDHIDPILYPVLRKELIAQGPRFCVYVGDKLIDYNEDFRVFLTTRNSKPSLAASAASIVTSVNFTITRAGLAGQLLAATIEHEKPELEVKKTELLRAEEGLKSQLKALEEALLHELASADGNILENKTLLDSLSQTKTKAATIATKLEESVILQQSLDRDREAYRPLATAAAQIFFVISDLVKANNMYQFSLAAFLQLFQTALSTKDEGFEPDLRIKLLRNRLQSLTYDYVCRSLFKSDRLMFAMHMAHGMHPGEFDKKEWEFFIGLLLNEGDKPTRGRGSVTKIQTSAPSWVPNDRAVNLDKLMSSFAGLPNALSLRDEDMWVEWVRSAQCEVEFPSSVTKKISRFQQVLVVQALRPDRLESAMSQFARSVLDLKDISPSDTNLRTMLDQMKASEPLLIIVSEGVDPSRDLSELADEKVGKDRFHEVAMGQGQSEIALEKLKNCAANGDWLCLKNLHLMTAWLPTLEKAMNGLTPHENFRLWLTTEAHPKFSSMLLQSSLKLTYESPPGLKKNLTRTYETWTAEFINSGSSVRAQSLFVLAFIHAVLQERRVYIPQGWTKFYEFSGGDLRTASAIVSRVCNEASDKGAPVKWEDIQGLLALAVYGGRIDSTEDFRILTSYLKQVFSDSVISSSGSSGQMRLGPGIVLPTSTHIGDYLKVINSLPEIDSPGIFGLPVNIGRSIQRINSTAVIDQLKILMRSSGLSGKFDRAVWQEELNPVLSLWTHLNQGRGLIKARVPLPKSDTDPLVGFVELERYLAIELVQHVHTDLENLTKIINGSALLTPDIQRLAQALLRNETPMSWAKLWDGPEDPLVWCRQAVAKTIALGNWADNVHDGSLLDSELDLSELFKPDVFLNALRQQTARIAHVPMDKLKFVAQWRESSVKLPLPCKISSLRIQGAMYDGRQLAEVQRDSATSLPVRTCMHGFICSALPCPALAALK